MTERAFVLGLDGVPWDLIEQWTDAGELPNFRRLREEGAAGPCQSTTPATTPVAWPSIATGQRADDHGVYGFHGLSGDYTHRMNTSADVDATPLWERLSPAVVGNVPMTYPASEIDGSMVAGMLSPAVDERLTHPPELAAEIDREIDDYRISLPWREFDDEDDQLLAELDSLVEGRRELMELLIERHEDWRLFFFVFTAPDRLQHLYWEEDVLLDHYRTLDDVLGEVIEYVASLDATLFVVSDHGFGPMERTVNLNTLLEREGFLARDGNGGVRGVLDRVGLDRSTLTGALANVGLDEDTLVSLLPRAVVDGVAEKVPGDHALYDVDFAATAAFMHFHGAVYVNDAERFEEGTVPPDRRGRVRAELHDLLAGVTDPDTGEQMLKVSDGTDLFPTDDAAPDLIVKGQDGYLVDNALHDTVVEPPGMAAGHRPEGVFMAWGPDVAAGVEPATDVYDVAPTVLASVGEPVPETAHGEVCEALFREDAPAIDAATGGAEDGGTADGATTDGQAPSVDDAASEAELDEVEDRLKGLGYL